MPVTLTCQQCGTSFGIPPSHLKRGKGRGRFCSRACATLGKLIPVKDRFWSKVRKEGPLPVSHPEYGPCWLWAGTLHDFGYGRITEIGEDGKRHQLYAHRLAWQEASGTLLTNDDDVCHTCDVTACVRNDEVGSYEVDGRMFVRYGHLFVGAAADNGADMADKARSPRGDRNGMAELTEHEARRAVSLYVSGTLTAREIGRVMNVSEHTIGDIINGRTWRHLTGGSLKGQGRDGRVKLTAEDREAIRAATGVTQAELARHYGVDQGYVSQLRNGKR